jgi:hypothetical protein
VANPGEGVPTRCFWIATAGGKKIKICVIMQTWPLVILEAWPRHPDPDPAPGPSVQIEGVAPELLRDLEILDGIEVLSRRLSRDTSKAVREAVSQGVKRIQERLPSNISLSSR